MLGVGLRTLCPLDSFGKAFREKKTVAKGPLEGLRAALFCQLGPTWPPTPLRSRGWAALGALLGVLGASWGVPGRSRAPLGGPLETSQEWI